RVRRGPRGPHGQRRPVVARGAGRDRGRDDLAVRPAPRRADAARPREGPGRPPRGGAGRRTPADPAARWRTAAGRGGPPEDRGAAGGRGAAQREPGGGGGAGALPGEG